MTSSLVRCFKGVIDGEGTAAEIVQARGLAII